MKLKSRQLGWMFRLVKLVFACALLIASITPSWALAQAGDDPWAEPLNLSHSGVAMNPAIVTDSEGVVHVVWQDDQGNFVYTRSDGDQWTAPETTDLNRRIEMPIPIESTDQSRIDTYTDPNLRFIAGPGRWDPLTLGHVVDFIQLHAAGYYWPAFNVADSAITVGVVLILWDGLRESRAARDRPESRERSLAP